MNAKDENGKTPLFYSNSEAISRTLLRYGAYANVKDNTGKPLLFYTKSENVARLLIDYGAVVDIRDSTGKTLLFYLKSEIMIQLLVDSGADVNIKDNTGKTPLFYSFANKTAKLLINLGADVNVKDNEGKTAIFYITGPKDFPVVSTMEELGLNVEDKDNDGNTFSYLSQYIEFKSKHNVRQSDSAKSEQLYEAVNNNNIELARKLLEDGADVDTRCKHADYWNMIHLAVHRDNPAMIEMLVKAGVDINCPESGGSPLEKAAYNNHVECFKKLLELGADPALAKDAVEYSGGPEIKALFDKYYSSFVP
ncbi:MAG: ankyrin repeat domain-containing protein [Proteobacteria bacterium]|nr:ankyrin repeat domain-containing protein [Pseudomonadota bacterium]